MNKKLKTMIALLLISPMILSSCGAKNVADNSKETVSLASKGESEEGNKGKENNENEEIEKEAKVNKDEFTNFMENLQLSRETVFSNPPSIKDEYINWFNKGEEDFSAEDIEELVEYEKSSSDGTIILKQENQYDKDKMLTYEEAKEDVDRLFSLFRYCYGAYGYMGGDEVFNEAKEKIMSEIEGASSIKCWDFNIILRDNLLFIKDPHVMINGTMLSQNEIQLYYIGGEDFFKDDKGYYKMVEGIPHYVTKINEEKDIEKFMKQSINSEGRLVYRISILRKISDHYYMNIPVEYTSNEEVIEKTVTLEVAKTTRRKTTNNFEYRVKDNIPIAKVSAMSDTEEFRDSQERFLASAEEMKDYPISILDLRGNQGGFQAAGLHWIESFTGKEPGVKGATWYVDSNLVNEILSAFGLPRIGVDNSSKMNLDAIIEPRIENDKVLFVLIDSYVGSAGEYFVEDLMNVDNVIFVGTNTLGNTISGSMFDYILGNSKISLKLGFKLNLTPYGEDFTLRGFQPDILVHSDNALSNVFNLIEYYRLNGLNE